MYYFEILDKSIFTYSLYFGDHRKQEEVSGIANSIIRGAHIPTAVARTLRGGGVFIHIFMFYPTSFF